MDWPQAQSGHEALESQRRWLNIAAMEPDPARRAEALEQAKAEGNRAIDFAVGAAVNFDRAMREASAVATLSTADHRSLQDRLLAQANPHPAGTMAAEWWLLSWRAKGSVYSVGDWLIDRKPWHLRLALALCLAVLTALSFAVGSPAPLGMGVLAVLAGRLLADREAK